MAGFAASFLVTESHCAGVTLIAPMPPPAPPCRRRPPCPRLPPAALPFAPGAAATALVVGVSPPAAPPAPGRPRAPPCDCTSSCTFCGSRPSAVAAVVASRSERTASTGTASTLSRSSTRIETSEFIPGISAPSRLSMRMSTGNIVTLCCTVARGSIFSTTPRKVRPG